jgi:hypothetical protein
MKNIFISTLFIVFAAASGLYAADGNEPILKQIAVIEKDPLGKESDAANKDVIRFARESNDVIVNIQTAILPWINEGSKYSSRLTAAFIAGNMLPQLKNKIKEDNPYEGLIFVFAVYEKIKKADADFRSEGIEYLISLYKQNQLKEHIAAAKKNG